MKKIEPIEPYKHKHLGREIQDFWTRNVNAERIMGKKVTRHARGEDLYFQELETQRYRSHRYLPPWLSAIRSGHSVLEIGCGVGLDAYTLAQRGLKVTAVDLTYIGVATARQRFQRNQVAGNFAAGNAEHLPFRDNSFDYVYSFGVLHHAADTAKTIEEVYRVLKPGGEARIMLYHRHSLNELVHRLLRVPFEEKNELCPVVRRFTRKETRKLFRSFRQLDLRLAYVFGEGYGMLFDFTPRWLYNLLSRYFGWHILIIALK